MRALRGAGEHGRRPPWTPLALPLEGGAVWPPVTGSMDAGTRTEGTAACLWGPLLDAGRAGSLSLPSAAGPGLAAWASCQQRGPFSAPPSPGRAAHSQPARLLPRSCCRSPGNRLFGASSSQQLVNVLSCVRWARSRGDNVIRRWGLGMALTKSGTLCQTCLGHFGGLFSPWCD